MKTVNNHCAAYIEGSIPRDFCQKRKPIRRAGKRERKVREGKTEERKR